MADDSSGKGRRGKKKGRGRQQEHNALGSSGGRVAVDKQQQRNKSTRLGNGVSADQAPFPVVLDSRFSSMHSAPVRRGNVAVAATWGLSSVKLYTAIAHRSAADRHVLQSPSRIYIAGSEAGGGEGCLSTVVCGTWK